MAEFEVKVHENGHLASYEYPHLIGLEIFSEEMTLKFDPVHSDTEELNTSIENLERLSLTLG